MFVVGNYIYICSARGNHHPNGPIHRRRQIYQPILFENQNTFSRKKICYGCSQHYHDTASPDDAKQSHNFSVMVHSMTTEMVSNVSTS